MTGPDEGKSRRHRAVHILLAAFNGLTTFDVMVSGAQTVTVEVFDAVGRQVATPFDGEMTGGQRFPMSLDSADLRSGEAVFQRHRFGRLVIQRSPSRSVTTLRFLGFGQAWA